MKVAGHLLLFSSLYAVLASPIAAQTPAPVTAAQQTAHDRLFQLFKESDEASLKRNPMQALFRGDLRYADRLRPLFRGANFRGEKAAARHDLPRPPAIPPEQVKANHPTPPGPSEDPAEPN